MQLKESLEGTEAWNASGIQEGTAVVGLTYLEESNAGQGSWMGWRLWTLEALRKWWDQGHDIK